MKDIEVLKVLIEHHEEKTTIRGLSKRLKMDYKNTYGIVKKLNKIGLISFENFGRATLCTIKKIPHHLIFQAEYERREKMIKNNNMKVLYNKLNSLQFSFIALVFGSFAKKKEKKYSDIDLMIICEESRKTKIENVVSLIPLNIHLVSLTYEEFLSMMKSKEFTVVSEAVKNNFILIGIEDYYRLLKNVE